MFYMLFILLILGIQTLLLISILSINFVCLSLVEQKLDLDVG